MRHSRVFIALGLVLALALGMALAVKAEAEKPQACIDKKLCAEKIRYGTEAFNRQQFREAKAYFREAVQADPTSLKAWSYYDLCVMYDVADQVKNSGQVTVSGGPKPGCPQGAAADTASSAPAAPPKPAAAAPAIPAIPEDEGC